MQSDSIEESEHGSRSVHEEYQVSTPPLQTALKRTNMPSSEVAMFLIEIYFARLYNAHLLFHKETFLADFIADRVPDFVALGIFASASMCVTFPNLNRLTTTKLNHVAFYANYRGNHNNSQVGMGTELSLDSPCSLQRIGLDKVMMYVL